LLGDRSAGLTGNVGAFLTRNGTARLSGDGTAGLPGDGTARLLGNLLGNVAAGLSGDGTARFPGDLAAGPGGGGGPVVGPRIGLPGGLVLAEEQGRPLSSVVSRVSMSMAGHLVTHGFVGGRAFLFMGGRTLPIRNGLVGG